MNAKDHNRLFVFESIILGDTTHRLARNSGLGVPEINNIYRQTRKKLLLSDYISKRHMHMLMTEPGLKKDRIHKKIWLDAIHSLRLNDE